MRRDGGGRFASIHHAIRACGAEDALWVTDDAPDESPRRARGERSPAHAPGGNAARVGGAQSALRGRTLADRDLRRPADALLRVDAVPALPHGVVSRVDRVERRALRSPSLRSVPIRPADDDRLARG